VQLEVQVELVIPEQPEHLVIPGQPGQLVIQVLQARQGRLVIPAALRRSLGLGEGDTLVARQEQGMLVLEKPEAIKQRLLARFTGMPADCRLVDELLAERRLQAQQEEN
jgi:AbrB family looped-hinge helix DNA binding protein